MGMTTNLELQQQVVIGGERIAVHKWQLANQHLQQVAHVASRMLYQALSTYEGVYLPWWRERIGVEFAESREHPAVAYLLDYLGRMGGLVEEPERVRLTREKIASAFIHLLNANVPANARDRVGVNAMVGGY